MKSQYINSMVRIFETLEKAGNPVPEIQGKGHDIERLQLSMQQFVTSGLSTIAMMADEADLENLLAAWSSQTPMAEPMAWPRLYGEACGWCGENDFEFDGYVISAKTPCTHPQGYVLKLDLNIPSGRMIIGNDFRNQFPIDEEFDINGALGTKNLIEAYAQQGMLHFLVGNSCPSLYPTGLDQFIVATPGYDESDQDVDPEQASGPALMQVCTDLWWVSICDGDEADARGLLYSKTPKFATNVEIAVTPGIYQLTYYVLDKSFDRDAYETPTVYADLKLMQAQL